ncbi:alpha/beta hydrolase [Streptomyces caatingaensis]|uniref:alpha/beta hydrolase n=1 Tax=Streptomyces caatingaensis TaxID=1678637 RepID=UPI000B29658B|nr:alpha/beta hydrolase [Streptomyces caatingaensis]
MAYGVSRRAVVVAAGAGLLLPRGGSRFVPRLPEPAGPHPVGSVPLYLVDRARHDPWEAGIAVREVMATAFYPARTVRGFPAGRQMERAAVELFGRIDVPLHRLPAAGVDWAATASPAHPGAPAAGGRRRPVLLFSPGGAEPRAMGTSLAAELASWGYVVVALDHPGDASEVAFPVAREGRDMVRPTRLTPGVGTATFHTMIAARVADLRFVLDELAAFATGRRTADAAGRPLPDGLARALDPYRVGLYGHSAGGTAVTEALRGDHRVRAVVNLEGYLDDPDGELFPVAREGADRPLLLAGTDGFDDARFERSWGAVTARSRPWLVTRRRMTRATHWVFSDYASLAPQLERAGLMAPEARRALVGAVGPEESVPLLRHWVRSFFTARLPPPRADGTVRTCPGTTAGATSAAARPPGPPPRGVPR